MNVIDIDQERESDDSSISHDKSHASDGKYEEYEESQKEGTEAHRTKSSSEYTPYNENGQAVDLVYDRYDSDYEAEQPGPRTKTISCFRNKSCEIGKL